MADIWEQFRSLPKSIRDGVATPKAIASIDDLESKYPTVDLANFVMRIMVREFQLDQLPAKLQDESDIALTAAKEITDRLRQDIFIGQAAEYLGLSTAAASNVEPPALVKPTPTAPVNLPFAPTLSDDLSGGAPVVLAKPVPPISPVSVPPSVPPPPVPVPPVSTVKIPAEPTSATPPTKPASTSIGSKIITPPPMSSEPPVKSPNPVVPITAGPKPMMPPVISPASVQPGNQFSPTTAFSTDDQQEIDQNIQRLKAMSVASGIKDLDSVAQEILTECNVGFSDELLARRAVAIIKSRLKNIRTAEQTAEVLTHDVKIGGLGLDPEIAAQISRAADVKAEELKSRGMVNAAPFTPPPPPPPVIPEVSQTAPAPLPPLTRSLPDQPAPAKVIPNITEPPRPSRPIVRPPDMPAPAPMISTPPPPPIKLAAKPPASAPVMQGARMADRPTVADVVRPTQTVGPVEEMRGLTLADFRKMGQGANDSIQRLFNKFNHLQKESYSVWSEAVAGWRQSQVHQLYLIMGRESLEQNAPISQIIADRDRGGRPFLSEHEFKALADLNKRLQA